MILEAEIYLGGDTDCETCGSSFNTLRYAFHVEHHIHVLDTSIGCYGGEEISTSQSDEAFSFLRDVADSFPRARPELLQLQGFVVDLDKIR